MTGNGILGHFGPPWAIQILSEGMGHFGPLELFGLFRIYISSVLYILCILSIVLRFLSISLNLCQKMFCRILHWTWQGCPQPKTILDHKIWNRKCLQARLHGPYFTNHQSYIFKIWIKSVSRRAYTDPLFTGLMEEAYKEWELLEKQTGVELVRCTPRMININLRLVKMAIMLRLI